MDKRKDKRFLVGSIESFNFHETNRDVEMYFPAEISLRDISAGGLGIKSSVAIALDTTLSVNLELEGNHYVVIGKVVWCRPKNGQHDCGLKVIYMPEGLISQFIRHSETKSKYQN